MTKKSLQEEKRQLNKFVHCVCGITYISGYTHCPSCGKVNPNDQTKPTNLSAPRQDG